MEKCCSDKSNRIPPNIFKRMFLAKPNTLVEVCRVCRRKHHTIKADSGLLGLVVGRVSRV